ncbi:Camk protein kinase [Globisporangium polare]
MTQQLLTASSSRYAPLASLRASLFGEILLCVDTRTQEEVVVKTVDLVLARERKSRTHEQVQEDVLKEVDVLAQLGALGGHANVIAMREYFVSDDQQELYVVMEYCEGGDLLDSCVQSTPEQSVPSLDGSSPVSYSVSSSVTESLAGGLSRRIPEYLALGYLRDVLAGLRFLHANGIAHRDLSLENILLRGGRAVIADFGLCAQQQQSSSDEFVCSEIVGKHYYIAPEVATQSSYDPRLTDIWSLGVAFFILLTSSPPFELAIMEDQGFRFVAKHGIKAVLKAWELADTISEASQDLLERMLQVDARRRISTSEILRHPAVTGFPTSPVSACDTLL